MLLIIGIGILLLASVILLISITETDKNDKTSIKAIFSWFTLFISMMLLIYVKDSMSIKSSKPFKINTIINTEVRDSVEIKRDTLYVLIRNK